MTPEQRVELIQAISKQRAFEYVDSLLAQARADALEEAAKAMDDRAREWSDYKDRMPASATAEHNYVQGRINAFTEAENSNPRTKGRMMNDGQIEELVRLAETQSAKPLVAYVKRLLAAERAAVVTAMLEYLPANSHEKITADVLRKLGEKRE